MDKEWPTPVESASHTTPKKCNKRSASRRNTSSEERESKHMSKAGSLTTHALAAHDHLISNLVCLLLITQHMHSDPAARPIDSFNGTKKDLMEPLHVHRIITPTDAQDVLWNEIDVSKDMEELALDLKKAQNNDDHMDEAIQQAPEDEQMEELKNVQTILN